MPFKEWRKCLLKRGAHVLVNINFDNIAGVPERWQSATLVGVSQYARLCRVRYDDTGDHWKRGSTEVVVAARVKRAITH